jgi:hypothetical protein
MFDNSGTSEVIDEVLGVGVVELEEKLLEHCVVGEVCVAVLTNDGVELFGGNVLGNFELRVLEDEGHH